ncbi:MAG: DNA translocase FtsK, partial [Muribaculaceae bacterium]|nr:DNA translocase FtsK [Muribaculaceae bacterium]
LCLFLIGVFVIICLRDLINWIIRLKTQRDERRRIEAEKREEQRKREEEIEEMRKYEEAAAAKVAEVATQTPEEPATEFSPVSFSDVETGLYTTLPDFDEIEDTTPSKPAPVAEIKETEVKTTMPEVRESEETTHNVESEPLSENSHESPAEADHSDEPSEENMEEEEEPEMVVNVNSIAQAKTTHLPDNAGLPGAHPYKFPPFELLKEGEVKVSVDAEEQLENKDKIKKTLLDFGIPILSIEATVGPTVTLYEIVPDKGVRIAKIRTLVDDIALSLAAEGVRIIAPIPGKGTVGIEVANKDPQTVSMRTIIKSKIYQESKYKLPIAMGSTISNDVYIADLAKMPHLLVAGATGQGKSVGLNAIIASLLYRKTPDELKFVMIDPKMVEFSLYAKIEAHYLAKIPGAEDAIITDMDKVVATLSSLCVEMDNRYTLLKDAHARNIIEYNDKVIEGKLNPAEGHRFMPYIVVVVDEFSDLIMTAGKEVEIPIARLAQKARAVGMHVIIATQRPSTNVITGIIKANFPARMAFKVSSGVDSKTILDTTGAQQLIGRGDMLISNSSPMVRVQCAFIDTPEVEAICDYIERQPYGQGAYQLPDPVVEGSEGGESEVNNTFGDRDPLFDEVARLIVTSNTASTSSLQRRYSIGYNRAGKIMDQLEAAGIVGPAHGGKPRSVLVDPVTLESILNSH